MACPGPYGCRLEITVCRAADVELLDRCIGSAGATSFHALRFARQQAGESTHLVAWLDGLPVGHAEVRRGGCADPGVRAARPGRAEINGLGVWPEHLRSRGIGSALIRRAEALALERGHTAVGLGAAAGNPRAAALHARLGYRPLTDYLDRWTYRDAGGTVHECVDPCTFLVREPLAAEPARRANRPGPGATDESPGATNTRPGARNAMILRRCARLLHFSSNAGPRRVTRCTWCGGDPARRVPAVAGRRRSPPRKTGSDEGVSACSTKAHPRATAVPPLGPPRASAHA